MMATTGSGSSSSSFGSMLSKAKAGRPIKSQSVPPVLSTIDSITCMEYEQLNLTKKATSAPMSASSSRRLVPPVQKKNENIVYNVH